jgi:hypothetical protein
MSLAASPRASTISASRVVFRFVMQRASPLLSSDASDHA